MKIFIIGQTSLHWGRMEFGNIGNFYIIEPFMIELQKNFPGSRIRTTLQMSESFCSNKNIEVVPLEFYYSFEKDNLDLALSELGVAEIFSKTGKIIKKTPFIHEVMEADLVIDFSGDIWGDNADFLGKDRFLIGLIKNRVAQLLGKKTVMLAGSPGPFENQDITPFAREVYSSFTLVTNREPLATQLLKEEGFDLSHTKTLPCPAFLFEPLQGEKKQALLHREGLLDKKKPIVGFIVCGWNFTKGPFDRENRLDSEFNEFAESVEYISEELGLDVYLLSHSNGFPIPPEPFKLKRGRDYVLIKQLQKIVHDRGIAKNIHCFDGVYDAWETKTIIGEFDMLISGRIHGAVAGLSQHVPTVIIDYGHEPKAHKIKGFAQVAGVENYVADPSKAKDLIQKIDLCWKKRIEYRRLLEKNLPLVKDQASENFKLLSSLF